MTTPTDPPGSGAGVVTVERIQKVQAQDVQQALVFGGFSFFHLNATTRFRVNVRYRLCALLNQALHFSASHAIIPSPRVATYELFCDP